MTLRAAGIVALAFPTLGIGACGGGETQTASRSPADTRQS
jgi:hypothetical protein